MYNSAEIAIAAAGYTFDRRYKYFIPPALREQLQAGMRVLVPFSASNRKTEGLVLSLLYTENTEKLKPVFEALDESPVANEQMIRLIGWMRARYFCTYYDALRTVLPGGLGLKFDVSYTLTGTIQEGNKTKKEIEMNRIVGFIESSGGRATLRELQKAFDFPSLSKRLRELMDASIIASDEHVARGVGDKTAKYVSLCVSAEELEDLYKTNRSTSAQREIVKLLLEQGDMTVKDLLYFTGCGSGVIKTLEKKGVIELYETEVYRNPFECSSVQVPGELRLSVMQQDVYQKLACLADGRRGQAALLIGVTGSGKTQVYIRLMQDVLEKGRRALVLVPEISLTPQLAGQFIARFGGRVAVLHSALSAGERYDEWKRIKNGLADVVIGTRSAVFAPMENLGLIIIDEEQEHTYKSENAPRYHARDVAIYRCAADKALLLLGSATPSLESAYYAETGRYTRLTLTERYNNAPLPSVTVVDMKKEIRAGNTSSISSVLLQEIQKNLTAGEQTILFINRRGSYRHIFCAECGEKLGCPNCSVSMTYHNANERVLCHVCGYSEPMPAVCPLCGSRHIMQDRAGTQRVEQDLIQAFPNIRTIRMDYDTTSGKYSHQKLLDRFRNEKADVLLGTQMVAKGLDFENVTLTGILDADISINSSDFRAAERTFSMITQVAGRAGRGEKTGRAVIQTLSPKNQVIEAAATQDYEAFYQSEIALRDVMGLPPFYDLLVLTVSGTYEERVLKASTCVRQMIKDMLTQAYTGIEAVVLGPAPASVVKKSGKFRYRVIVKARENKYLREMTSRLMTDFQKKPESKDTVLFADMNPYDN